MFITILSYHKSSSISDRDDRLAVDAFLVGATLIDAPAIPAGAKPE
jgi:hypothetical protein